MKSATTQSIMGVLSGTALVLGLSGVASGQGAPPPAGPLEDIQATLDVILDRLYDLEDKLDDLEGKIDTQATDLRGGHAELGQEA
jgi:hypothetical protein